MRALWRRWSSLFSARAPREKWIIGFAVLAAVYAAVDVLWLTPSLSQWQAAQKELRQRRSDLAQLSSQVSQLADLMRAQELQTKSALDAGQRDLAALAGQLAEFERNLVPARRMTEFLQGLLPGRDLEVVGLKTLPPAPLITRAVAKVPEGASADGRALPLPPVTGEPAASAANLYKHGIEITLAGSYPALLGYLDRLEKSPQKVLFGRMDLRVDKYPRSELTLTLYTLSLDRSWLIV